MKFLKRLKRAQIAILALVLLSFIFCGAMMTGVRPALAALSPPVEENCSVTWLVEQQPTGVMLGVKIECPQLMRLTPINRLHLSPVDRKW